MKFSKKIVVGIIVFNLLFTVAILYIHLQTYSEPSTLIVSVFSFTTGELWFLSGIKKQEVKKSEFTEEEKGEYNGY